MKQINVWTLAVVALFVVLLTPMINVAYEGSAQPETVDNESITVDYNEPQEVTAAADATAFNDTVTVRNSSGVELVGGIDYEWGADNGSVSWMNTSSTSDGESATISYGYSAPTQTSENVAAILSPLSGPLGYLILIVALGSAMYYAFGRGGGF